MRIYHGRAHVFMSEKFLDGPDVVTVFEQVGHERMPDCWDFVVLALPALRTAFFKVLLSRGPCGSNQMMLSKHKRPRTYARRACQAIKNQGIWRRHHDTLP